MVEQKAHRGKLWKMFGKDQFMPKDVGLLLSGKSENGKVFSRMLEGKTGRDASPMATGVSHQRSLGSS